MLKCTAFFSLGNAGWSETYFQPGTALTSAMNKLRALVSARLRLCHSTTTCIGLRVADTANPSIVLIGQINQVGSASGHRDLTNAALLWTAVSTNFNRRQIMTRGQPDEQILNGVYQGVPPFDGDAAAWATKIVSDGWCIRVQDRASFPIVDGAGVSTSGVLTTFADQPWAVGDSVKFFRSRDITGKPIKGVFKIAVGVPGPTFTLANWPAGRIVGNCRLRKYVLTTDPIATIYINKATSRKTGRPFGSPRGRAVARR